MLTYDDADRVISETTGGRDFINGYDGFGRLTSLRYRPEEEGEVCTLIEHGYDTYPSTITTGLSFQPVSDVAENAVSGNAAKGLKT